MPDANVAIKVFLADCSILIRDRVAAMLGARGMSIVCHATTPADAIEGILVARPDVVVLDVQLEGGTGLQVLRAVRRQEPRIAFVVFSLHSAPGIRLHYFGEGAKCFIDKATEIDLLSTAIDHLARAASVKAAFPRR